jgi:hypothetical protein
MYNYLQVQQRKTLTLARMTTAGQLFGTLFPTPEPIPEYTKALDSLRRGSREWGIVIWNTKYIRDQLLYYTDRSVHASCVSLTCSSAAPMAGRARRQSPTTISAAAAGDSSDMRAPA